MKHPFVMYLARYLLCATVLFLALFCVFLVGNFLWHMPDGLTTKLGWTAGASYRNDVVDRFKSLQGYLTLIAVFVSCFATHTAMLLSDTAKAK